MNVTLAAAAVDIAALAFIGLVALDTVIATSNTAVKILNNSSDDDPNKAITTPSMTYDYHFGGGGAGDGRDG